MSEENVRRAHRVYEAMNRGDLEAGMLPFLHPNGEFHPRLLGVEGGGTYRGHDGAREWWRSFSSTFPDLAVTVLEVRAIGDVTLSKVRFQGHGEGSGAPFDETIWQVSKWHEGRAIWVKSYLEHAEALKDAGLSEK